MQNPWEGVFSAVTTKFRPDETLDLAAFERHIDRQVNAGVHGIIVLGSLGENSSLAREEKLAVIDAAAKAVAHRVPLLSTVAETTTKGACSFAAEAEKRGVDGFMVLPGIQYPSDRSETIRHYRTVASNTDRPIMIYINPVSYRVDITPDMLAELADEKKFVAVKESSDNIRRVTDIRNLLGDRYRIFTGVDDIAMESLILGAVGWVAGLVCAFPKETVALYRYVRSGRLTEALDLYRWFMPLLHLDVSTKFVQNIKLAEQLTGEGTEYVRAPRLPLSGEERARIEGIVARALAHRPSFS